MRLLVGAHRDRVERTGRRRGQGGEDLGDLGVQRHQATASGSGWRLRLLAGEDVVDLVLGPALAGDPLQLVGHGLAGGLVGGERLGDRARAGERVGERAGVHDRGVGALALVVAHRVGGVAEQHDGVGVPGVDGVDVVDGADVDGVHVEVPHRPTMRSSKPSTVREQVVLGDLRAPGAVGVQRGDVEGHLAAVAQREHVDLGAAADVHPQVVVDDEAVGRVGVDHHAVGVLAGEDRLLVAEQLLAHGRLDAVGADDQVGGGGLAVGEGEDGALAGVVDPLELVADLDHAVGQDADERVDEVAAVDEVGVGVHLEVVHAGPGVLHDRVTGRR